MRQSGWACVCRMGGLGDNLVAASVCRPLKQLGYSVEMISTVKDTSSIFRNNPFIDKLSLKSDGDIPGGDGWQEWFQKRAGEYEIFGNLSHSMEHHHAFFKGQTEFWWPQEFRRKIAKGSYLETAHDIFGVPYSFGPLFFPTEEEVTNAKRVHQDTLGGVPFLAWVISGSRIDKIYPYTAQAVARIITELDIPVVLFGVGDKQAEMALSVKDHVGRQNGTRDKFFMFVQDHHPVEKRWPLRTALSMLLQASCVVTPDTGSAWAVAFEKMPKIMLSSHASAENITKHWINTVTLTPDPYRVPCWPCHRLHDTEATCVPNKDLGNAAACISDYSVQRILDAVNFALVE
jgi:ADP-heptose:LPS heptosyltransferase